MNETRTGQLSHRLIAACGLVALGTTLTVSAFLEASQAASPAPAGSQRGVPSTAGIAHEAGEASDPSGLLIGQEGERRPLLVPGAELRFDRPARYGDPAAISACSAIDAEPLATPTPGSAFLPAWLSPCVIPGADAILGAAQPSPSASPSGFPSGPLPGALQSVRRDCSVARPATSGAWGGSYQGPGRRTAAPVDAR